MDILPAETTVITLIDNLYNMYRDNPVASSAVLICGMLVYFMTKGSKPPNVK